MVHSEHSSLYICVCVCFPGERMDTQSQLVERLRSSFCSGVTIPEQFRQAQLKRLMAMIKDNEQLIINALHKDLAKVSLYCTYMHTFLHKHIHLVYWSSGESGVSCPGFVIIQNCHLPSLLPAKVWGGSGWDPRSLKWTALRHRQLAQLDKARIRRQKPGWLFCKSRFHWWPSLKRCLHVFVHCLWCRRLNWMTVLFEENLWGWC